MGGSWVGLWGICGVLGLHGVFGGVRTTATVRLCRSLLRLVAVGRFGSVVPGDRRSTASYRTASPGAKRTTHKEFSERDGENATQLPATKRQTEQTEEEEEKPGRKIASDNSCCSFLMRFRSLETRTSATTHRMPSLFPRRLACEGSRSPVLEHFTFIP